MLSTTFAAYCRAFPSCRWGSDALRRYDAVVTSAIAVVMQSIDLFGPVAGLSNRKTHMVNEGTCPGDRGTCDRSCVGDCKQFCYAIAHGDGVYSGARRNHAINTVYRRRDPYGYYRYFFALAARRGASLRANETGDFESVRDLDALESAAREFPRVRVIGYTKRRALLGAVARVNKLQNVQLHYSLACCHLGEREARAAGVPCTLVTFDSGKCTCPAQLLKLRAFSAAYERATAAGRDERTARALATRAAKAAAGGWSCALCAARGCGCFGSRDVAFLAH